MSIVACDEQAGNSSRNDVWLPDVIGIADDTADKIEATQRSTATREVHGICMQVLDCSLDITQETLVAIPIISLESPENRKRCQYVTHSVKFR